MKSTTVATSVVEEHAANHDAGGSIKFVEVTAPAVGATVGAAIVSEAGLLVSEAIPVSLAEGIGETRLPLLSYEGRRRRR